MNIDARVHFPRYRLESSPGIDGPMAPLQRDFRPEQVAPLLASAGFDGCIAVQLLPDERETRWLLDLAEQHDFIRGVVGWADICAGDACLRIGELANHPQLCAIRYALHDQPAGFIGRDDFRRGIAALAGLSLPFELLIYPRQFSETVELATAFPGQRFVLDGFGQPDAGGGGFDAWARGIAALSRRRNVWCKLSPMLAPSEKSTWSPEQVAPYIDTVLDWFGPERTMVGSGWPRRTLAGDYTTMMSALVERIGRLAFGDQRAVLGDNAAAFYRRHT